MYKDHELGPSIRKLLWKIFDGPPHTILHLVQSFEISEILARIMVHRGIADKESAEIFLNPKLHDLMPDPFLLQDMRKATDRVYRALQQKEKVTIFADYDVDGATSAALLRKFFRHIGINSEVYVPNRITEGYGPNIEAFYKIKDGGSTLIITVDCGTSAFDPIKRAKEELNLDVIVIDHHMVDAALPEAVSIINPNRPDDNFPFKSIAAVAVVFFFVVAMRKILRELEWFSQNSLEEPNLIEDLDLVAFGTVCDVMPLVGLNRAFVHSGLRLIAARKNIGFCSLTDSLKLQNNLKAHHLGYVFGPRINAGGRISEGNLGAMLLASEDKNLADTITARLEFLNKERQALEAIAMQEAIQQIEERGITEFDVLLDTPVIIVTGNKWHIGLLGILASKLRDKYSRPVFALSIGELGVTKGSARSIRGIDVGKIIIQACSKNILLNGGGHPTAGGFSIATDNILEFSQYVKEEVSRVVNIQNPFDKARELYFDAVLDIGAINNELIEEINKAEPFGHGNSPPKFILRNVVINHSSIFGKRHVFAMVSDVYNQGIKNKVLKVINFYGVENEVGRFLLASRGQIINLAGTLQTNYTDHTKVDFIVEDISVENR